MIVIRADELKPFQTINGSEVIEIVGLRNIGIREVSVAIARVKGGSRTLKHRHDFLEIYYIAKGEGVMHIEEESRIVHEGDFIVIPRGSAHYIENLRDDDLIIWCICSPAFTSDGTKLEEA